MSFRRTKAVFTKELRHIIRDGLQMQGDGDALPQVLHHFHRAFDQMGHHGLVHVFAGAPRALENYRRARLDAANNDGLDLLQIVKIVSRHGIASSHGLLEHLPGINQPEFMIIKLIHYPDSSGEIILVQAPGQALQF